MKRKRIIRDIVIACSIFAVLVVAAFVALAAWYTGIIGTLDNINEKAIERGDQAAKLGEFLKGKDFSRTDLIESLCSAPARIEKTLSDKRYTVSADLLTEDDVTRTSAVVQLENPSLLQDAEYIQITDALGATKAEIDEMRVRFNNSGKVYNTFRLFFPEIKLFDCGCE